MTTPKLAKVCAVVGVGPGLGLSLCRRFGQEGFKVAMLARDQGRLEAFRRTLAGEDIAASSYGADAGDTESLTAALDDVQAQLGSPDVLIYNAYGVHPGAVSSLENRAFTEDWQTNVLGALVATKKVLPAMTQRNTGTLLFTGGGAALTPRPDVASLSIGKAALRLLALNLAEELQDTAVRASTVAIFGTIGKDEHFSPARIAETYWQLHIGAWQAEVMYQ